MDNSLISFIYHFEMVILLHCMWFHKLPSSSTQSNSTWNSICNQALSQAKDLTEIDYRGNNINFPKVFMVDLKWTSHQLSQNQAHHLYVYLCTPITTHNQCCHLPNIIQHYSIWISFQHTYKTSYNPPCEKFPISSWNPEN